MEESGGSEGVLFLVLTMAQNDDVDTVNTRIQDFHRMIILVEKRFD